MADSDHSGLRPLSPHGEGYCRFCHFVEGLDASGRIEPHTRWQGNNYGGTSEMAGPCKGSGRVPPKLTPHTSRLAAFRLTAEKLACPVCRRTLVLLADGRIPGHTTAAHTTTPCPGGWQLKPPSAGRDHTGERG
jgi:hypothetical protein